MAEEASTSVPVPSGSEPDKADDVAEVESTSAAKAEEKDGEVKDEGGEREEDVNMDETPEDKQQRACRQSTFRMKPLLNS